MEVLSVNINKCGGVRSNGKKNINVHMRLEVRNICLRKNKMKLLIG